MTSKLCLLLGSAALLFALGGCATKEDGTPAEDTNATASAAASDPAPAAASDPATPATATETASAAPTAAVDAGASSGPSPAAAMSPDRDLIANLAASPVHSKLLAALQAAGLTQTLQGEGPYSLFAPTDAAFDALPAGTLESLLQPANKAALVKLLSYHIVEGRLDTRAMVAALDDNNGKVTLTTLAGEPLVLQRSGPRRLALVDAAGNQATMTVTDIVQANGMLQVIDAVLRP